MEAEDQWSVLFRHLSSEPIVMESTVRPLWEEPTGVYKVFYLLVDGVTCCITHSKDPVQKSIGEVVHGILTLLIDAKGLLMDYYLCIFTWDLVLVKVFLFQNYVYFS